MYKIDKIPTGYKLTFGDRIEAPEMQKWADESHQVLKSSPAAFGVVVDMRTLKPLSDEAQVLGQKIGLLVLALLMSLALYVDLNRLLVQ
mgnify:CR=1 FL=1